jgi:predicted HTH transcriptional regulator
MPQDSNRKSFSDTELLMLLKSTENSFVERKTYADTDDWVTTAVAFANTCPLSDAGVLFIGAYNDGTIQPQAQNLDTLQKTLAKLFAKIFPSIRFDTKTVRDGDAECLAVIVSGSQSRPHMVGSVYVRRNNATVKADDQSYGQLIAERSLRSYELSAWQGKTVTVELRYKRRGKYEIHPVLDSWTSQYVVVTPDGGTKISYPFDRTSVAFDFERNRLKLEVTEDD